jgi:hypothetical protein
VFELLRAQGKAALGAGFPLKRRSAPDWDARAALEAGQGVDRLHSVRFPLTQGANFPNLRACLDRTVSGPRLPGARRAR